MSSVKILYFLYDLYDAVSDDEIRQRVSKAPLDVIFYLREYLDELSSGSFELTYQERKALKEHKEILLECYDSTSLRSLKRTLRAVATRKFVRDILRPILSEHIRHTRAAAEHGSDGISLDGSENASEAGEPDECLSRSISTDPSGGVTDGSARKSVKYANQETVSTRYIMPTDYHENMNSLTQVHARDAIQGDDEESVKDINDDRREQSYSDEDMDTKTNRSVGADLKGSENDDMDDDILRQVPMNQLGNQEGGKNFSIACQICHKKFSRMSRYNDHMNTHLPPDQIPFSCQYCGRKYSSFWTKTRHEKKCPMRN